MTEADKAMLQRMRAGWEYLEQERIERIRRTVTKDELAAFDSAYAYSLTLPPRLESGFTEFYRKLAKAKR